MSTKLIVEKLRKEINGRNQKEVIDSYYELLSEDVKELSKTESFFHLPLKNIFCVISKTNFNFIEEIDDRFEILQNIIKNTINAHYKEKETLLILHYVDISQIFLSYERILYIFGLFTNCPILQHFINLNEEKQQLPEKDYEYELKQKEQEIEKLKQQIKESQTKIDFQPISGKPNDFETNIFKACKEGKLTSVQWLVEKGNIDKNKRVEKTNDNHNFYKGDTPIHIASKNGHLSIVQYLIEKQNVDINIKGYYDKTPLHYACWHGHLPIANYLISKGANTNTQDIGGDYIIHYASCSGLLQIVQHLIEKENVDPNIKGSYDNTPLHYAYEYGHLPIVEYLISKGAKINATEKFYQKTPLHLAVCQNQIEIVRYLVSKGASKILRDKEGKKPKDFAQNEEIRNIL